MRNFGPWAPSAQSMDLHNLVNMIATGRNADTAQPEPVAELSAQFSAVQPGGLVLDFGCGVGRNAIYFSQQYRDLKFTGYDCDQMLSRAADFYKHRHGGSISDEQNLALSSDWDSLKLMRFDVIYATLVFQHIEPTQLRGYLEDIKKMTPLLCVHGRRFNDYGYVSTWGVLESCGLIPANAADIGYEADGDPHQHIGMCIYRIG